MTENRQKNNGRTKKTRLMYNMFGLNAHPETQILNRI